ncbi:MAG: hypothetical protein QOD42_1360 [Sphingomonadales bacterium]|nr:hypothetical protein [Sphingomonadales bacterium]
MTGWHLSSGKEQGGSDAKRIVTDAAMLPGRQRTARRFAVGRRSLLGGSITFVGLPGPPGGALLPSRLLRPITATSSYGFEP